MWLSIISSTSSCSSAAYAADNNSSDRSPNSSTSKPTGENNSFLSSGYELSVQAFVTAN
jgi:hypothetical protein